MRSLSATLILGLVLWGVPGCNSSERQYEDFNVQSPADLTLAPINHPHGYGRGECFTCHLAQNIHQQDLLGDPRFDSARDLVNQYGLRSCAGCHGDNGVVP